MAILIQQSRGRRLLLAVLQRTSAREVAARCRVVPSCVSEWTSGDARPGPAARELLERCYGVPRGAWSEPPPSAARRRA